MKFFFAGSWWFYWGSSLSGNVTTFFVDVAVLDAIPELIDAI